MQNIIINVEKYVIKLIRSELPYTFFYHNLSHTQHVVKAGLEICEAENIAEKEKDLVQIALWLHDIGYVKSHINHEYESEVLALEFLKSHKVEAKDIALIVQLIRATKVGYEPETILECIVKDADTSHVGSKDYFDISELLRNEWEYTQKKVYTDSEWTNENIVYTTKCHHYYTNYALINWQKNKDKNLRTLLKKLKKQQAEEEKNNLKKEELLAKKNKATLPERGIDTMFRVTLRNHITLSDIADTKANILLSVNAIIVSLVLANLLPKLDNPSNTHLVYPTVVFVLFTVATMILSVLATRPNVTSGKFTKEDVKQKKVNLLFFGNFHKMKLGDFEWAINELMKDKEYLYNSMTKDLYFLGKVLDRKYKILRVTYTFFIIGIVISLIAFSVAFQFA